MITIRQIHLIMCAGLISLHTYASKPQFKTDFSGGIPPEVILIDGDGNTPATAMANIGFAIGVPWIGYYLEEEDEYVACSTSWYKPAGTSDDWMILPAVSIEEGAILKWRAKSSDKKYFDGYAVYLSTEGPNRDAFDTEHPLFVNEAESNEWSNYEIDLSDYCGQDINIAFVNNSTNKARLYVDDIQVGTNYPLLVSLTTPGVVKNTATGTDIIVKGTVSSELDNPEILGDISLRYGAETIVITNASIKDGACEFEFNTPLHIDADECAEIEVICTSESGETVTVSKNVWSTYRPLVVEEFTATWCSWCVRGIVYMEVLKEHYGDMMIPMCVHETDVMESPEYISGVDYLREDGIPNAILNRKYECDPSQLFTYCEDTFNADDILAAITSIDIGYASVTDKANVSVGVAFRNTVADGAYRLAYITVEDNVYQPDDLRYCQKNAYSGGNAGAMGGFEDMPSIIPPYDIIYHDVVRGVSVGGPHGVPMSLPGVVNAGDVYTHDYAVEIPASTIDKKELSLIVLLLDTRSNEVLNARKIWLRDYDKTPGSISDISVENDTKIDVYTIDGLYVGHYPSQSAFVSVAPPQGIYIVKPQDGPATKISVVK